ncbi:MAG: thioredoxin fold domain-containing protein [Flavobacteriales bacterium]|nr:thioredoxin fold domain-containing protein [Flavobacteriales bacterium]
MKNLLILIGSFLLLGCSSNSQPFINLNPIEFQTAIEKEGGIILDVRTPQEVSSGAIENASTIDFYDHDFERKISKIQKDKTVFVYCKSGGRSSQAAKLLLKSGQAKVVNLSGGIMAWQATQLPLIRTSKKKDKSIQELSISDFDSMLSQNNLVLADFHTLWCMPCRKISPMIDELKEEYINSAQILRIDMDNSELLAESFEIKAVPTLILFKESKEIWRHTGLISKEELTRLLDSHL